MASPRKKPRPATTDQKVKARPSDSGLTRSAALVLMLLTIMGLAAAYRWQTLPPEQRSERIEQWGGLMDKAGRSVREGFNLSVQTVREMLRAPVLPIRELRIACGPRLTEEKVREAIMADGGDLLRLDLEAARARIEQLPWTDRAVLQRVYPDTLEVRVEELSPVAVMREPLPAYLAAGGQIITEAPVEALAEFPVVQVSADAAATPVARANALRDATALILALETGGLLEASRISEVLVTPASLRVMAVGGLALRLPRERPGEALEATRNLWKSQGLMARLDGEAGEVRIYPDGRLALAARRVPRNDDQQ